MKIVVIQGPNLDILRHREQNIFGGMKLEEIHSQMEAVAKQNNFEIESFDPLNTHIENNKKDKVEINDQKVTNAPAILAVAQPMEPTRKMTKGDQLINEFCQSYKEMKGNEFYEILNLYNIRDLEYIYKMISTLPIKLNANEKGYIKYYIARLQKRQKVA